jgi:hypothetical protein
MINLLFHAHRSANIGVPSNSRTFILFRLYCTFFSKFFYLSQAPTVFAVFDTISQSFSLEKSSEKIILEKIVAVCEEVSDLLLQCKYQCLFTYMHSYVYMFEIFKRISKNA